MRTLKVNWEEVEADYLNTSITYDELAEKYNVSKKTINRQSLKSDWKGKKEIIRWQNKLNVDRDLDTLIGEAKAGLAETQFKSKEGCIGVLIKLYELEIKRCPRTVGDLASLAVELDISPQQFLEELNRQWQQKKQTKL